MTVKYSINKKWNVLNILQRKKWYAIAKLNDELIFKKLIKKIPEISITMNGTEYL